MPASPDLAGYRLSLVNQEDLAWLTVEREGREVAQRTIRVVHDLVPFVFEDEGATFQGLMTRNEKNAVLVRDGKVLARRGRNPDFRKVCHLVFTPGPSWAWRLYSVAWHAAAGLFVALALVFGLFSSLDLRWIAGVAVVAGLLSYAIERARDQRIVPLLNARYRPSTAE